MSLLPRLLWLTLNLALIIQCLTWFCFYNFTYPVRCLLIPPGVRAPNLKITALRSCLDITRQLSSWPCFENLFKCPSYNNLYLLCLCIVTLSQSLRREMHISIHFRPCVLARIFHECLRHSAHVREDLHCGLLSSASSFAFQHMNSNIPSPSP
jgi:hypothetical protein